MKTFRKYAALYRAFFAASLTADLEFRTNFALRVLTDLFWYIAQIATFEVLFNFTNQIGAWNRAEVRVFLGVQFVVDAFYMVVFSTNLDQFSDSVRKGNLDLLLTKPVNSQFIISCQRAATPNLGNMLLAVGWLAWALHGLEGFVWWRLVWLLVMVPAGTIIFYVMRFMFSATAVIFTRAENIQYLWYNLYRMGLRPDNIYYPIFLRWLVLTIVPVGLIASVPARMILGLGSPALALWALAVAAASLWISSRFWHFALARYASASS